MVLRSNIDHFKLHALRMTVLRGSSLKTGRYCFSIYLEQFRASPDIEATSIMAQFLQFFG